MIREKAKLLSLNNYGTRKSRTTRVVLGGFTDWISMGQHWQSYSSRSRRRKFLLKQSNRKLRRFKGELSSGGAYKKLYDVEWLLD